MAGLVFPQESRAEEFTGTQFFEWTKDQQVKYVEIQLVMATTIATRMNPELSQCLSDRFFAVEGGMSAGGFDEVIQNVQEFREYHPSSVLVVTMESACGPF